MVENSVGKALYKLELFNIKIIPYIMMGCYICNTLLSYFGIDCTILSLIGGTSILTILFLLISSVTFRFCIYHRLPIYYIIISDVISYYDILVGIPLSNRSLFSLNLIIEGVTILLIIYFRLKLCVHK